MRIHVFKGRTLPAALAQVRAAHGDDAIVLDTTQGSDGATVRVGVEPAEPVQAVRAPAARPTPTLSLPARTGAPRMPRLRSADVRRKPTSVRVALSSAADQVAEALAWHGAPPLATRSLLMSVEADAGREPADALARALGRVFRFGRPDALAAPLAFVGPPGAGKTATLAKLAAARYMSGERISIVNADLDTAGAPERVAAFAAALGATLHDATSPYDIARAVAAAAPGVLTLVDTSGRAPADLDDVNELAAEIAATGDAALVLSAAIAPAEAAELAECFSAAGARHLVMTQLDIARRIGALLAAADAGDLVIAGVSLGRKVGDGLQPLTAESLAKLILAPPSAVVRPIPVRRRSAPNAYTDQRTPALAAVDGAVA